MDSFGDLIRSGKTVVVDFYADWCGPCKTMAPILKQVKDTLGDAATIIKIDIDKNPAVASQYQVQSIPTLLIFKNGQVLWRQAGIVPAKSLVERVKQFS